MFRASFLPSCLLSILGLLVLTSNALGQIGDKPGEAQPQLVPAEMAPPSPALSPAEQLKTFQIAPGFRIELVASEPLIGDPVAAQFGPDGRLWVVEMRGYMPDLDGTQENQPSGRIVILTDVDGDGRMDRSDVFLANLVLPRALCLVGDGALIGAPPMLWYCPDKDRDGKADEKIEVARDFGMAVDPARPELANPERAPNSLLWALDNWIYCGAYAAKFRYRNGAFERAISSFRGQWGLSQDDFGRLFHNSNSDSLRGDLTPSQYLLRNPYCLNPVGANVAIATKQDVWPIRVNPGINRGYRPEMLRDFKLKNFTAACAPFIERTASFSPECKESAFVCEPAGNLVKRYLLTAADGSLHASDAYEKREFLASTDERFRPVNLTSGPDGALYLVDFYRGVIQHRISLTTYLRQQSEARGLVEPRGLGRIWRLVPEGAQRQTMPPDLSKLSSAKLAMLLAHESAWTRDTAQRLLVERNDEAVVPALETLAKAGSAWTGRLHALWVLDGMQRSSWPVLQTALADAEPRVRNAAVRICESLLTGAQGREMLEKLTKLSAAEGDPQVQLQIVATLSGQRDAKTEMTLAALIVRAGEHPYLVDALVSGLVGRELDLLESFLPSEQSATSGGQRLLSRLAGCIAAERDPLRVARFLALAEKATGAQQVALLAGFAADAATGARRPVKLAAEPALLALPAAAKLAPMLTWPGKPAPAHLPVARELTAEEQVRMETGRTLYNGVCAACHQPHGLGLDGLAPPLLDSEWVLGSPERLIRIVLHGVRGPIDVKGTTHSLDMPPMGVFDDDQLSAILTYIRRAWDHTADPISPEHVQTVRSVEAQRQDSWTEPELLKIK